MKIATIRHAGTGAEFAAAVAGHEVVAFDPGVTVVDILSSDGPPPDPTGARFPLADCELLAPIRPSVLFGVGLNYSAHAAEQGAQVPEQPIIFTMQPGAAADPFAPVVCPPVVRRLDYEGELAVIIGRSGTIAGYCVANDVSARDLQRREPQWTRAKGFDGAVPFGPWITTVDEVPDPLGLRLRTWVNGEIRQDTSTADMIFSPQRVVDFLSETCALRPGDVIVTGTPSGVGESMDPPRFLSGGDEIRIQIEGLGEIRHVVAEAAGSM